eukprot:g31766.t1
MSPREWEGELKSRKVLLIVAYGEQMLRKSVTESVFDLSNVGETKLGATDTVDQVGGCTGEPLSDLEGLSGALDGVDPILNNDKTEYRKEIDSLAAWYKDNNLSLKVSKMKELVIDFRKWSGRQPPFCTNGPKVEMVESFKFLRVNITNNLSWSIHVDVTVKYAHQRLYFLRRLREFSMSTMTLINLYRCTIEKHPIRMHHSL